MKNENDLHSVQLYDLLPFPFMAIDTNGTILYSSHSMLNVLGLIDGVMGTSVFDYIYLKDINEVKRILLETLQKGSHQTFEVRGYLHNKTLWLKGRTKKVRNNEQDVILLFLENITEQKYTKLLLELNKYILKMIVKRKPLANILDTISLQIEELFMLKTYCSFILLGEDDETFETVIAPTLDASYSHALKGLKIGPRVGSCGTAMYRKETVICSDLYNDPLWEDCIHLIEHMNVQSCWSVPVFIDEVVVGSFAIYHPHPSIPTVHDLELIHYLAGLIGLAIERSQIEKNLIVENEKKFHVLIDHLPDVVYFKDEHGCWTGVNKKAREVFSVINKDIDHVKSTSELFKDYPHLIEISKQTDVISLKNKETIRAEAEIPTESGEFLTYDFIKTPYYDEYDLPKGIVVIGRDITDRKKTERLLEESEQRYKSLFEYNPNAVYSMDLDGKLYSFNTSFLKMFGYPFEEVHLKSFVPYVVPECLEETVKHFNDALKGIPQIYETIVTHKNGQPIYVKVINVPIIVQDEIIGVFGIAEDITILKQVIEEQSQTKDLLESIFMNSGDSITVLSFDGIVKRVNPATVNMYGWSEKEIFGSYLPILPDEHRDEMNDIIKRVKAGKKVIALETVRKKKDGTLIDVSVTYSPHLNNKGEISGIISISRDISNNKHTETLLKRTEKLAVIGQLSAAVAHEIRNPLTTIKGFIQLYEGKIQGEINDLLITEVEHIESIVTEFLALAKPQVVEFKHIDITAVITKTMAILEKQAIYNQLKLNVFFEDNLPAISCNEQKIKQVIVNIVKNAIESMRNQGELYVNTKREGSYISIAIKDAGCGISKEKISKLGEPFYSNKEKGTGLGLMVCFKIIEEHKGKITIESEVGIGTTVTIFLPI